MQNNIIENLKDLFKYSSENVVITDYDLIYSGVINPRIIFCSAGKAAVNFFRMSSFRSKAANIM